MKTVGNCVRPKPGFFQFTKLSKKEKKSAKAKAI